MKLFHNSERGCQPLLVKQKGAGSPFHLTLLLTTLVVAAPQLHAAEPHNPSDADITARLRPPKVLETESFAIEPNIYTEPAPLALPSTEALETITIRDQDFVITAVAPGSDILLSKKPEDHETAKAGLALHAGDGTNLVFKGTGGAGLRSKERLIVENCTFVIDFQKGNFGLWDARRCAIYVDGYKEVLIRNCVFVSKALKTDPERKVNASVYIQDSVRVQIEDCYFEGMSNWMRGHVTVYACGPTSIRRVEVSGQKQGTNLAAGGGIWVGNGIGEGKLGAPIHADQPELMIYPSGPLLVESCNVHDQRGVSNADGIYVQSIHPFLIRNCRVDNWMDDSLIDVGFRDSARGTHQGKPMANHGAVGVIENCEFGKGYIKDSVGAGGGVVFRNNVMRDAWFFPYIFDGGSWLVIDNRIEELGGPMISGYNYGTRGWAAPEGMLINGSKFFFFRNFIASKPDSTLPALFVSPPNPASPLKGAIVSDSNAFHFPIAPMLWAEDRAVSRTDRTLADWQTATGNDRTSTLASKRTDPVPTLSELPVSLPPGVPPLPAGQPVGLVGPVGPSPAVKGIAMRLSTTARSQLPADGDHTYEFESLRVIEQGGADKIFPGKDAGGGAYRLWTAREGQCMTWEITVFAAGSVVPRLTLLEPKPVGKLSLLIDGKAVGAATDVAEQMSFPAIELSPGLHAIQLELSQAPENLNLRIDRLRLDPSGS